MRILFVAAEAAPVAKVGGMGDVVGALPKVLRKLKHDVRIFLPYYGFLQDKIEIPSDSIWQSSVMGQNFAVYETILPGTDVPLYLLEHHSFAPRRIYYGEDEGWRFTLFANAAAEFAWHYWTPQVIHCHDWHTGMIPVWMRQSPEIQTVFTIHNLSYQGPRRGEVQQMTWCPDYMQGETTLAAALHCADRVTTVSPTYACQIQTPEYGERLEGLLCSISDNLVGILNGIDTESYNPGNDKYVHQNFTIYTLDKRTINKISLQEEAGLEVNKASFLVGMVTRLVEQKGIDLVLQILEQFFAYTDAQMIILGTGEHYYETRLWELVSRFPGRLSVQLLYNDTLARQIYAGSDAFLMPSRFEPCGISQLLAMRYGCVPMVRNTGGLIDTVSFHDPVNNTGTGYNFNRYDPLDLYTCMIRTWESFRYKDKWQELQKRGMKQNFSWYKSAIEYVKIYKEIAGETDDLSEKEEEKVAIPTEF